MATTAFITGGAGFIGSHLARHLAGRGERVVVFDNLHAQVHGEDARNPNLGEHVEFVRGDVRSKDALSQALSDCAPDVVYHLAAETGTGQSHDEPARYCDVNILGTCNLVEGVRKVVPTCRRIVLAGSRAVYGEGAARRPDGALAPLEPRRLEDLADGRFQPRISDGELSPCPTPESIAPRPASIYASTKLMQELVLAQCAEGAHFQIALLRFQNVYGPRQSLSNPYTGVLSIFARQILDGKQLEIFEDGAITRDFVFIDDVVRAAASAGLVETIPAEPINIGSGQGVTILEAACLLLQTLGASADNFFISGRFRPGDVRHAVADVSRARTLLDWRPEVELSRGLAEFASWVREERRAGRI